MIRFFVFDNETLLRDDACQKFISQISTWSQISFWWARSQVSEIPKTPSIEDIVSIVPSLLLVSQKVDFTYIYGC